MEHLPVIKKVVGRKFVQQVNKELIDSSKDLQLKNTNIDMLEIVKGKVRQNRSAGRIKMNEQFIFNKIDTMLARKALDDSGVKIYMQ